MPADFDDENLQDSTPSLDTIRWGKPAMISLHFECHGLCYLSVAMATITTVSNRIAFLTGPFSRFVCH